MATLVRHVMAHDLATASPDMNACDAAGIMVSNDIGCVPVVDGTEFRGLVTDRDLVLRVLATRKDPLSVRLGDILTHRNVVTTTPDSELSEARELMSKHKVRRLPVMKGTRLVGVVSLGDVAVASSSERAMGETIREISESPATATNDAAGPVIGTPRRVVEARSEG